MNNYFGSNLNIFHRLGKTIQIVTFLRGLFESKLVKSALIVMPKVVLENWNKEFSKWYYLILNLININFNFFFFELLNFLFRFDKMSCLMFHGSGVTKFKGLQKLQQTAGVCFTTYGSI